MKYSHKSVTIYVELQQSEGNIVIDVKDNGFGIEKNFHKKIFKQHQRVENSKIKGYGIGLAYTRQVARDSGGDAILVESAKEKGSHFRVIFKEYL